ncbi:MAG: copper resistance protein NlpE [Alistipes sp.]|nr:copper resistance protein NlpE [Alistipes sp.]
MRYFKLGIIILLPLLFTGCGQGRTDKGTAEKATLIGCTGTYRGIIPCADCDGIEVTLTLTDLNTYSLKTRHIVSNESLGDIHSAYSGRFDWNHNTGLITLLDAGMQPDKYLCTGDGLVQLDLNGNRIAGPLADRYILKKQ